MTPSGRDRLGAALGLALCAAAAALALASTGPPAPRSASAPDHEFSAERAQRHVEAVAQRPRPPGTAEHRRVADYLLSELRALDLRPEIQEGWVAHGRGSRVVAARVRNLLVRLPGRRAGEALLLVTHYDSVPTGPGAGDDAAGVAAVLEALRALLEGPPPANDVIVLVTDGEESGLLGARLFVDEHPWAADVRLVLNFEARGNRGPVNMFETSRGNGRLVRALAGAAPHPFASSLGDEVYRRMPNDTDLTVFLDAGLPGLNFAMIGNHPAYHTELDTAAGLSRASLQHHGSYVLALSRSFGGSDLADLTAPDAVYFNALGSRLVVYPVALGGIVAWTSALALLIVLVRGVRRGRLGWAGVRGGLWGWLAVTVGGAVGMYAVWRLFAALFPAALATPHGEPYEATGVRWAALLVVLGIAALVGAVYDRPKPVDLLGGVLLVWAALGLVVATAAPGAGYLFGWPTAFGVLGLAAALAAPSGLLPELLGGAGAVVASLVFAPTIVLVTEALQVNAALLLGALCALPVGLALPLLRTVVGGRLEVGLVLIGAGLALLGWIGGRAAPGPETPAPTSLFYLLDREAGEAWWLSYEDETDEWLARVIPPATVPQAPPEYLAGSTATALLRAPAPALGLAGPTAELVSDDLDDDVRRLAFRVASPRAAPFAIVRLDASLATLEAIGVGGRVVEVEDVEGSVTLTIANLPPEGVVVEVRTFDRQPLRLDVLDWSWGLPAVGGAPLEPRPSHLLRRPRWLTDSLLVRRAFWF